MALLRVICDNKAIVFNCFIFAMNLAMFYSLLNANTMKTDVTIDRKKNLDDSLAPIKLSMEKLIKEMKISLESTLRVTIKSLQENIIERDKSMGVSVMDIQTSIIDIKNSIDRFNQTMLLGDTSKIIQPSVTPTVSQYDLSHLTQQDQHTAGPIQDDEALCIYGLVKALRPFTVVEFGFAFGHSSLNFLKALDKEAKLYSYDIIQWDANAAAFKDARFKFFLKSQTEFSPVDIDNRTIDLAYMDAEHTIDIQTSAFEKIIKQMSPTGIIIVHDTGLHREESVHCACDFPKLCGHVHQIGERLFINWISKNYPEWQIVNIHSFVIFRHGLTVLQRKYNLSTEAVEQKHCL